MEKLLNYSGLEKYNDLIHDELDQKANIDGYYESLGSGTADQLSSNIFEEDSEPYHFRTSGGSIDIGDRETDMLVGGSVAWNQLIDKTKFKDSETINGVTFTNNGDGSWTISGTATSAAGKDLLLNFSSEVGHKVMLYGGYTGGSWGTFCLYDYYEGAGFVLNTAKIYPTTNATRRIRFQVWSGQTVNVTVRPMFFDLTQKFGSTVADAIASLESGTAGAGVAFFRKYFPKPYYPYDAGTIKSVDGVSAHKTVGFNAWDEEWELGYYDSNGQPQTATNRIRSKNYIPIVGGTTYYGKVGSTGDMYVRYYDADKNYISAELDGANHTFTTPSNAKYIRFNMTADYGTTYKNDICINLSWDGERDGEYEPYVEHSYPLDSSITLRGIPKLSNGKLYYDGDTYESDGLHTERFTLVDLGSLNYVYMPNGDAATSNLPYFYSNAIDVRKANANMLCEKYVVASGGRDTLADKMVSSFNLSNNTAICIADSSYTDAATLKTALSGTYLLCELATPTTETADTFVNPQIVDDFGTEEYITTSIVPVGHYTQYMANLKAKLEMSPDSPSGAGDYIVRQTNGENEYVSLASNATIQDIIARLEALEGGGE